MYFVVTRTSAEEYIRNITPELESNPAKYYELSLSSGKYTGTSPFSTVLSMYNQITSFDQQGAAILASINKFNPGQQVDVENSTYKFKNRSFPHEADFYAGDIPRTSLLKPEIMGLAVFNGDKYVGKMDGAATAYYLATTGEYEHSAWSFEDPKSKGSVIILDIAQSRKPQISVKLINDIPSIDVKIRLEANILTIQSGEHYETPEGLKFLEQKLSESIKEGFLRTYYIASRQYKSDIFGFGKKAKLLVSTWSEWEKLNWKELFPKASFNVDVDLKIRRTGLMIKSTSAISTKGKEY
jgi:spore germination protein KC